MSIQASDMFGYHSNNQIYDKFSSLIPKEAAQDAEKILKKANYIKSAIQVAGYFPVIGTIIAIAKLILIGVMDKKIFNDQDPGVEKFLSVYKKVREGMKIRAAIELSSLGFVLIIPDLMFTIERATNKHYEEQLA